MKRTTANRLNLAVFSVFFLLLVAVVSQFGGQPGYYPNVVVDVPTDLRLYFLREAFPERFSCETSASTIANAIRASCPSCKIAAEQCITKLRPDQQKLLSTEPLEFPSARSGDGVIIYSSADEAVASAACRGAQEQTASSGRLQAKCFEPHAPRPLNELPSLSGAALAAIVALLLSFVTTAFASFLIIRSQALHS